MSDFVIENRVLTRYTGIGGDVVIPEGVTEIGYEAFYWCNNITNITIPPKLNNAKIMHTIRLIILATDTLNNLSYNFS